MSDFMSKLRICRIGLTSMTHSSPHTRRNLLEVEGKLNHTYNRLINTTQPQPIKIKEQKN
jgi:hypothetical protein